MTAFQRNLQKTPDEEFELENFIRFSIGGIFRLKWVRAHSMNKISWSYQQPAAHRVIRS